MFKELNKLQSQKDKKILFVGIGNLLKMDDGVGVYISKKIKDKGNNKNMTHQHPLHLIRHHKPPFSMNRKSLFDNQPGMNVSLR